MGQHKKKISVVTATALVVILAVSFFIFFKDPNLGTVGEYPITKTEVEYRNQIHRLYNPEDSRNPGLHQLKKAFTYAQILKNNGLVITEETLLTEEKRIDEKTLMPEKLQAIKAVFQGNMKAYRKVFVLPTYVERTIYFDFFLKSPELQAKEKKNAEEFLAEVLKNPKQMDPLVKRYQGVMAHFGVSEADGLRFFENKGASPKSAPEKPQNNMPDFVVRKLGQARESLKSSEGKKWIDEVIAPLKRGEFYSRLVDMGEHWAVVQLNQIPANKKLGEYRLTAVLFPKANYEDWLNAETQKVPTTFPTH